MSYPLPTLSQARSLAMAGDASLVSPVRSLASSVHLGLDVQRLHSRLCRFLWRHCHCYVLVLVVFVSILTRDHQPGSLNPNNSFHPGCSSNSLCRYEGANLRQWTPPCLTSWAQTLPRETGLVSCPGARRPSSCSSCSATTAPTRAGRTLPVGLRTPPGPASLFLPVG